MAALTFFALNVPAGDGVGATQVASGLGPERIVMVDGAGMSGVLVLQGSNDATNFVDLPGMRFDGADQRAVRLDNGCGAVRVRREQTRPEVAAQPTVGIGALTAEGFVTSTLALTPADGVSAPFDLSSAGDFLTVILTGTPNGIIIIEGSQEAAGDNFSPLIVFGTGEGPQLVQTFQGALSRIRARRIRATGAPPSLFFTSTLAKPAGLAFAGPMLSIDGGTIRYDNAKVVDLTDGAIISTDASLANGFALDMGAGARDFDKPTNPRNGQKITYIIRQLSASNVPTWQTGSDGFRFADPVSPQGVKLADVDALFTAAIANSIVRIGFEYIGSDAQWDCVGIAGFFVPLP